MNPGFEPFPILITNRLVLRKVVPADVDEILFLRSNETVLQFIDKAPAESMEDALMFIEKITNLEKKNECINWAMVPKGETRLIGTICLWNLENETDKAEVGYSMHPLYYGQGYMHESMEAVLDYGFNTMHVKLIEAITDKDNTKSRNLLERNGFTRDAKLEAERVGTEEPLCAVIYSLRK